MKKFEFSIVAANDKKNCIRCTEIRDVGKRIASWNSRELRMSSLATHNCFQPDCSIKLSLVTILFTSKTNETGIRVKLQDIPGKLYVSVALLSR